MVKVKPDKKGQVSIPKGVLNRLNLEGDTLLLLETTPDGAILSRPAGYSTERYSDERIAEFLEADRLTPEEGERLGGVW